MHDPRFEKLARLLVEYSIRLKANESVLIDAFDVPDEMTVALVRSVRQARGTPFVQIQRAQVSRALALEATERQFRALLGAAADGIAVRLSNPSGNYYGGKTAAPVTRSCERSRSASFAWSNR